MIPYLIHFFDRHEHLRRSRQVNCDSDDEAIERSALLAHSEVLEVWQGDRRVWRFEPSAVRHWAET
ncbi:MAG TPA: hypothetical protein VL358_03190 [Caulobacteraceae bacterium]|jgi:hypothetical protein|nr:hypothetical protein [Caulobacteraceae bacterium]